MFFGENPRRQSGVLNINVPLIDFESDVKVHQGPLKKNQYNEINSHQ